MTGKPIVPDLYPRDRPLRVRRRLLFLAIGIACYLLSLILGNVPALVESLYGNTIGPLAVRALSRISGIVPLALSEVFVIAVLLRQILGAGIAITDVRTGRRRLVNAAQAGVLRLGQDVGVLMALFYLLWGFNYARAPLQERLGWPPPHDITAEELEGLAVKLLSATNDAYLEIHDTIDAGTPSVVQTEARALEDALWTGWRRARALLQLPAPSRPFGRVKTPLFTRWYEWVGVAGFYFPYTAEANLRGGLPGVDHPKMVAHEKVHQWGVARESEANFWGYLAAAHSPDAWARYSAFAFAQQQLLAALARFDRDRYDAVVAQRLPGVERDFEDSRRYWMSFRGHGTAIGRSVNDAFLRSNRVAGGVVNYSLSTLLFVAFSRAHGSSLVPLAGDER